MLGWIASRSVGMSNAMTSGRGVVHVSWWASGWSATVMPTIAPMRGPQMPAAHTTMSAGISPRSVIDALDVAVVGADVGHGVLAEEAGSALDRPARLRFRDAHRVGQAVRRHVIGADDPGSIDQRPEAGGLVRIDHAAVEPPRLGEVASSVDLREPLRRQGELESSRPG